MREKPQNNGFAKSVRMRPRLRWKQLYGEPASSVSSRKLSAP
jgi:hypothetical protein